MINSFVKLSITAILMLVSSGFYKPAETVYPSVKIGTQTWMTENLNVTHFRNGDSIPEAKTDEEWKTASDNKQPAWCYYNNDTANGKKYGKLYNWYAVNDLRGLAPVGWHISSDDEWTEVALFLVEDPVNKMKSVSGWKSYTSEIFCSKCKGWNENRRKKMVCRVCNNNRVIGEKTTTGNGNNRSGFNGFPAGFRENNGHYYNAGAVSVWWSSNESDSMTSLARGFAKNNDFMILQKSFDKGHGFSVRCLKD
jgi:uncharacterized protein (TIGR02145 family)